MVVIETKREKSEEIDYLYKGKEKRKSRNTTIGKSKKKKNRKKILKKESLKEENKKDELFNFEKEFVIGVTPTNIEPKDKKQTSKDKSAVSKSKKKNNNGKTKKNTPQLTKKQEERIKKNRKIKRILKWIFLSILIITAIILFITSPIFDIKKVNVTGNVKIPTEEIVSLSEIVLRRKYI